MDKPREASQEDQEESMPEKQDEELDLDTETEREVALLDDAIEFKMTGHYPDGLTTKDQKRSVRRKAQTIFVEHEEILIKKTGKVPMAPLQMPWRASACYLSPSRGLDSH